jgi:hypothetical protein
MVRCHNTDAKDGLFYEVNIGGDMFMPRDKKEAGPSSGAAEVRLQGECIVPPGTSMKEQQ